MTTRVALVTGGNKGIGEAIARTLAKAGHHVAITGRDEAALARVAEETGARAFSADVTDAARMNDVLGEIRSTLGPVTVLVQNAGVAVSAKFLDTTDEDLARLFSINVTAAFRLAREVVPDMLRAKWGRIVQIASNAGLTGYPYTSAYCASKHAVVGLVRALAVEYASQGITVNALCPGFVDTDMTVRSIEHLMQKTGKSEAESRRALEALSPQRRFMTVAEVAEIAVMLLGESARGINGQAIAVDGGQVLH